MTDTRNDTQPDPNRSTEPGSKGDATPHGTDTQPAPNVSTEHQQHGDARSPSDTLDRGQEDDRETPGGQPQEAVEDRPNVGTTTPDAYPEGQRAGGDA